MVSILDSTLREGEQTPGVYFDGHIKLAIAECLNDVGVDIIEAGHPVVSEEIYSAVKQIAGHGFNAKIGAHARSLKEDVNLALECGVDFLGIFYSITDDRLNHVFRKEFSVAVDQIVNIISFAREKKPDLMIRYTPEDTVRSDFNKVVDAARAAADAGANIISVADTTGHMVPGSKNNMYDYISRLIENLNGGNNPPMIAVHCHNDRGLALANALDAIHAGAQIVDASVMGLGERAGIVDLAQLMASLYEMHEGNTSHNLSKLTELYHLVSRYAGVPVPANFPVVGENAFTHCAGVHTHAAMQNPVHYQSLDPGVFGRNMHVSLDHMSGISSIKWALDQIGVDHDEILENNLLKHVKIIGQKGRTVDLVELKHLVDWCKKHSIIE